MLLNSKEFDRLSFNMLIFGRRMCMKLRLIMVNSELMHFKTEKCKEKIRNLTYMENPCCMVHGPVMVNQLVERDSVSAS